MKAIVIHEFGPPDVLKYEDVPDPVPQPGEIRIRIHAATVNRVLDVSLRAGKEPRRGPVLPLIPGVDCAGFVDALGPGITRWKVGQHVAAAGTMPLKPVPEFCGDYDGPEGMMGIKRPGGFAELVCVPACMVVPLPEALDFHDAAVVMRHAPTAWNLLVNVAQLHRSTASPGTDADGARGRQALAPALPKPHRRDVIQRNFVQDPAVPQHDDSDVGERVLCRRAKHGRGECRTG